MKQTSDTYALAMKERCRDKSHVKISLTSGSETYEFLDDEIANVTVNSDIDPLTRRVPKEELSFSIYDFNGRYSPSNPSGRWHALNENAKITIQFGLSIGGNIEWLSEDDYILSGRPSYSSGIASFKARSVLCSLTKTYYKGTFEHKSFYELCEDVLTDAGITDYDISDSLQDLYTDAPLPITTHLNCLQLIAHACCCTLRTVGGVITIAPFEMDDLSSDFIMELDSIAFNGDTVSKIDTLYKVESDLYTYTEEETETVVFESSIDVDEEAECHIEYALSTEQRIECEAETQDVVFYGRSADFKIIGTGTYYVKVYGKKVNSSVSKSEAVISLNTGGSTDSEKNQLITDFGMQSSLIYHAANYLQFRLTHSVKYRGNPELEPLDALYFETGYGPFITALILTHTITYNGALSGTMTIKSLTEVSEKYLYDANELKVIDSDDSDVGVIGLTDYISDYTIEEMDEFIEEVQDEQT